MTFSSGGGKGKGTQREHLYQDSRKGKRRNREFTTVEGRGEEKRGQIGPGKLPAKGSAAGHLR